MPLTVDYDQLRRHVGRFLGYGRTPSSFSSTQSTDVDDVINKGLREFYFLRNAGEYHVWSFLSRPLQITAQNNATTVELPEDFGRLLEGLTYTAGTTQAPIAVVKDYELRNLHAQKQTTGAPKYAAVRALDTAEGQRSRYELLVYPTPDADYQLIGRYAIEPHELSSTQTTPLGGALHSETIIEACLAAAENVLNPEGGEGIHAAAFARLLASSIEADKTIDSAAAEFGTWPLDADSTDILTVTKRYLRRLVGLHRGYGPNPENWTHGQKSEVAEALRTGLRNFYDPSIPGERYGHQWSFLRPVRRLDLIANQAEYDLPEDFAVLEGPLTYVRDSDNTLYDPIELVGEETIRYFLQKYEATFRPDKCAVYVADNMGLEAGTRWKIIFAPIPDAAYAVNLKYRLNPMGLSEDTSLPLGGQPHAQTIVEACLAASEELEGKGRTEHQARFIERLKTSIGHDREAFAPDTLGYNGDNSDRLHDGGLLVDTHDYTDPLVTYNGVQY